MKETQCKKKNDNGKSDFFEVRLPLDLSLGSIGGPEYRTSVLTSIGGAEYRNIEWSLGRMRFNIAPSIKNDEQMEKLLSFFHICRGKAIGFRFRDWRDFQSFNFKPKKIARNLYQIVKSYSMDNLPSKERIISKPVEGTVSIKYSNGAEVDKGAYSVDYSKGRIKLDDSLFDPTQDYNIFVSCIFDVPVRFDIDHLPSSIQGRGLYKLSEIPLIEIKI